MRNQSNQDQTVRFGLVCWIIQWPVACLMLPGHCGAVASLPWWTLRRCATPWRNLVVIRRISTPCAQLILLLITPYRWTSTESKWQYQLFSSSSSSSCGDLQWTTVLKTSCSSSPGPSQVRQPWEKPRLGIWPQQGEISVPKGKETLPESDRGWFLGHELLALRFSPLHFAFSLCI